MEATVSKRRNSDCDTLELLLQVCPGSPPKRSCLENFQKKEFRRQPLIKCPNNLSWLFLMQPPLRMEVLTLSLRAGLSGKLISAAWNQDLLLLVMNHNSSPQVTSKLSHSALLLRYHDKPEQHPHYCGWSPDPVIHLHPIIVREQNLRK